MFVEAEGTKVGFGSASTSADGRYTITGLAADTYKVGFSSTTGNYLPQWYKGQPTESTATPLTVSQGATDSGINARMLLAGKVTGRVTSTRGAGLSGICVAVTEVGEGAPAFATEAISKGGGSYSVSMLPTGVYAVGFSNCSSETTNYAPMWSGGSSTYTSAKGVRVRGGKTTSGVDARLPVGGAISGRLSNASGKPLGGICVGANSQDGSSGEATTSKNGSYSVLSLPTGAYTVSFCGNSAGYIEGSFQNDLANPVSVTVGKATAQVNATLVLGGKNRGPCHERLRQESLGNLRGCDRGERGVDRRVSHDVEERRFHHLRTDGREIRRRLLQRMWQLGWLCNRVVQEQVQLRL